jgi:endonuclease/exonuclease/phosphatase family metal-dependent hydrolase
MQNWVFAVAGLPAFLLAAVGGAPTPTVTSIPSVRPHLPNEIMVLTYNVQELPWALVGDRSEDLDAIGQRLKQLRLISAAPQVVVLQEAFGENSPAMLKTAGYKHIAMGPDASTPRPDPKTPLDPEFVSAISLFAGEGQAPAVSSGLIIASDYPILSVEAMPFPKNICAGYDCLANKGVMIVRLAVPGMDKPLEVVTSHLNAGKKSGVAPERSLYAHSQQLNAFTDFLKTNRTGQSPTIIAGDFNVSHSEGRLVNLRAAFKGLGAQAAAAMGKHKYEPKCKVAPASCVGELPIKANVPLVHTLDWQFTIPSKSASFTPIERVVLFGKEPDGSMLSDHIGYAVRFRLNQKAS